MKEPTQLKRKKEMIKRKVKQTAQNYWKGIGLDLVAEALIKNYHLKNLSMVLAETVAEKLPEQAIVFWEKTSHHDWMLGFEGVHEELKEALDRKNEWVIDLIKNPVQKKCNFKDILTTEEAHMIYECIDYYEGFKVYEKEDRSIFLMIFSADEELNREDLNNVLEWSRKILELYLDQKYPQQLASELSMEVQGRKIKPSDALLKKMQ